MTQALEIILAHASDFLYGLANTVWLTVATLLLASLVGCVLAALMLSTFRTVRTLAGLCVDAMRAVPFLMLAYLVYYGLPELGIQLDRWSSGLCALVIYHSAYVGEIVRAAWRNLPYGIIEAGHAYGFFGLRLFRRIVLPPLFYACAPLIGNQAVQVVKDTAFLMIITVPELTFAASSVQSKYFIPFSAFVTAVALYWALTLLIEAGVRKVEAAAEARRAN